VSLQPLLLDVVTQSEFSYLEYSLSGFCNSLYMNTPVGVILETSELEEHQSTHLWSLRTHLL